MIMLCILRNLCLIKNDGKRDLRLILDDYMAEKKGYNGNK